MTEGGGRKSVPLDQVSNIPKMVHLNLPLGLILEIDDFVEHNGKESRTSAIIELLRVGLILQKHKRKLEDPIIKQELKEHYAEGSLVDFVSTLNPKDFELFSSIMEDEKKLRKYKK